MNTVQMLLKRGAKLFPPSWLGDNIHYETAMGSIAYGVSTDSSDIDIYGFCIPPKEIIFPHLAGEIDGFGRQKKRFGQWLEHHIKDNGKEYDFQIYSIVKYFHLCMMNNPNMIDSLFTQQNVVKTCTPVAQLVRENRRMFLHKGSWHTFKGYAYAQVKLMNTRDKSGNARRQESYDKFGYDVKFAYHVVRLLNEVEQIMSVGDIDLQQNNEQLKSIRRGDWKKEDIADYFKRKEVELESLYTSSKLPYGPDEEKIKQLLLNCLEQHYGTVPREQKSQTLVALQKIDEIVKSALRTHEAEQGAEDVEESKHEGTPAG